MKKLKTYIYIALIIVIALILAFNKMAIYGLIVVGLGALGLVIRQQILETKDAKIEALQNKLNANKNELKSIQEELNDLRNRKLNISDIKNILDLGLLEVNTNFTRTWNNNFTHKKSEVQFIGALKVSIIAKFGIDIQELRFKYLPDLDELLVANVKPKFLSFSDLNYSWEISELLEYKKPYIGGRYWTKTKHYQHLKQNLKEKYQNQIHNEVKNGPEELAWMLTPLKKQIKNTIHLLLGSNERKIIMVNEYDDSFMPPEGIHEILLNKPTKQKLSIENENLELDSPEIIK